ncbi:MAG: PEP-CTERM system TPR-repeat protein PrsT, partial [Rhodospirillales bacterium]|nr:PEP-CTERM system TPR-repeat protein PrsT [Rhodospirillales bacterium]
EAYATLSPHQEALSGFAPAIYLKAALSLSQDNVEQAQSLVQRYLGMSGDDIAGRRLLASIFLRKKAYDRALQILDPLARERPQDSTVQTLLGYARMGAGHANEAAAAFAKAAEAQPDNNRLRTQLAYNQMLAGEDAKAIEQLQGLISRDPQDIQAILLLILGHLQHREYEPALKAAEDLKRAVPDTPIADNFIGVIQMSRDNEAAARTAFSEALRKRGDFLPAALNLAELDLKAGKPEAARLHYDTMLQRNPNQQEALMGMARVERAAGHSQAAAEWLEKAVRADPKAVEPRQKLVEALLAEHRTDKALMVARELVQALPAEPSAHDALGQAQMAAKDSAGAVVTYQQAVRLAPRSVVLQHRLGMALIALDRKQEGDAALERAVALDAGYMPAWQDRLDLAYRQGGLDAALDVAKAAGAQGAAASLEPWLTAEAMARAERWKEAVGLYRTAMERAPNAALARRLHTALMRSGDTKAARGTLEGWLKDHPEDAESRLAYAVSLIETGDMSEAIRQHESLLNPYPNNATLYNNLAWLYDRTGDIRALDYARRAQTLAPDSPDVTDTLGWLLVRNGQPQRGLELLKKAYEGSKDQGNQATIAFHLASALSQVGARNEARQILEPVLASDHAFDERTEARRLMDQLAKR